MAFIRIKGLPGKIYVPDETSEKKHRCKDCNFCQWCSDDKCRACLKSKSKTNKSCCKTRKQPLEP